PFLPAAEGPGRRSAGPRHTDLPATDLPGALQIRRPDWRTGTRAGILLASSLPSATVEAPVSDVTSILSAIEQGDPAAGAQRLPLVYEELRQLAAKKLAHEPPGQTLQATALVHEAYLRLVDVEQAQQWNSRGHFFAAAAEAMRRILVERARRKH